MQRRHALTTLLLSALLLPSCVTATVWGGGVKEGKNGSSRLSFKGDSPLSSSPWVNALATPFAFAIDVCLSPVQIWLYDWHGDDPSDDATKNLLRIPFRDSDDCD